MLNDRTVSCCNTDIYFMEAKCRICDLEKKVSCGVVNDSNCFDGKTYAEAKNDILSSVPMVTNAACFDGCDGDTWRCYISEQIPATANDSICFSGLTCADWICCIQTCGGGNVKLFNTCLDKWEYWHGGNYSCSSAISCGDICCYAGCVRYKNFVIDAVHCTNVYNSCIDTRLIFGDTLTSCVYNSSGCSSKMDISPNRIYAFVCNNNNNRFSRALIDTNYIDVKSDTICLCSQCCDSQLNVTDSLLFAGCDRAYMMTSKRDDDHVTQFTSLIKTDCDGVSIYLDNGNGDNKWTFCIDGNLYKNGVCVL